MRPPLHPHRRFVAALLFSALAHLGVSMTGGTGSPGRRVDHTVVGMPLISARLQFQEPQRVQYEAEASPADGVRVEAPVRPTVRPEVPPAAPQPSTATSQGDGGVADATYYPARQLDIYPTLASGLDRSYFEAAKSSDVKARVLLLVLIDALGAVDEVSVAESGAPVELEELARRAFLAARFTPAQKNGRAVKSRVLIEVNYGEARRAD